MKRIFSKKADIDIEIEDGLKRTFTVFEVRPYDVYEIIQRAEADGTLIDFVKELLPLCSNLTTDDLKTLYPSDLEKIYDKFKAVNAPFLKACDRMGVWERIKAWAAGRFQAADIQKAKQELSALVSG